MAKGRKITKAEMDAMRAMRLAGVRPCDIERAVRRPQWLVSAKTRLAAGQVSQ